MSRAITVINGVPRLRGVYTASVTIYDESTLVGIGGISTGTPISLPSSMTYMGKELQLFLNGTAMEVDGDYQYVGTDEYKTQIQMTFDLVQGDVIRFRIDTPPSDQQYIYSAGITVGVGGIAASTPISLPGGRAYNGNELLVIVNGVFQEVNRDFEWVGVGDNKTQISFTYDLVSGDRIVFRIEA